jgi:hypothetical protein
MLPDETKDPCSCILGRLPGGDDFHQRRSNHESRIDLLHTPPLASTSASQAACLCASFIKQTHVVSACGLPHTITISYTVCCRVSYPPCTFPGSNLLKQRFRQTLEDCLKVELRLQIKNAREISRLQYITCRSVTWLKRS